MEAPSRAAKLTTRVKVFKLKLQGYLDHSFTNLLTPRFVVVKVLNDAGEVMDVCCVWNCKSNGLNETIWVPGFMLHTALDAED
jgi:hypothetical protein